MEYGFEQCDILKISDNEIQFITGIEDYDQGVLYLQNKYEIPLILLTMGKKGEEVFPYIPFYQVLREKKAVPEKKDFRYQR